MKDLAIAVSAFIQEIGITEDWIPGDDVDDDALLASVVDAAITLIYEART